MGDTRAEGYSMYSVVYIVSYYINGPLLLGNTVYDWDINTIQ